MIQVANFSRRLKEGNTREDFRKAWYHRVGFRTGSRTYTAINAFDARGIIVIGSTETSVENLMAELEIGDKERV